jgi:hypothetical protein
MELVALLSSGKGTWAQVSGLITKGEWDKVILIGDEFAEQFTLDSPTPHEFIKLGTESKIVDLKEDLMKKLKGKISGIEVALSIASGNGKEHMALISALLSMPVGIRFSVLTQSGIVYL